MTYMVVVTVLSYTGSSCTAAYMLFAGKVGETAARGPKGLLSALAAIALCTTGEGPSVTLVDAAADEATEVAWPYESLLPPTGVGASLPPAAVEAGASFEVEETDAIRLLGS